MVLSTSVHDVLLVVVITYIYTVGSVSSESANNTSLTGLPDDWPYHCNCSFLTNLHRAEVEYERTECSCAGRVTDAPLFTFNCSLPYIYHQDGSNQSLVGVGERTRQDMENNTMMWSPEPDVSEARNTMSPSDNWSTSDAHSDVHVVLTTEEAPDKWEDTTPLSDEEPSDDDDDEEEDEDPSGRSADDVSFTLETQAAEEPSDERGETTPLDSERVVDSTESALETVLTTQEPLNKSSGETAYEPGNRTRRASDVEDEVQNQRDEGMECYYPSDCWCSCSLYTDDQLACNCTQHSDWYCSILHVSSLHHNVDQENAEHRLKTAADVAKIMKSVDQSCADRHQPVNNVLLIVMSIFYLSAMSLLYDAA